VKKTRILLTGANGQLGQALLNLPGATGKIHWIPTDYQELDITDKAACESFISGSSPDYIINCAAYTAVDQAEKEFDRALNINSTGPENLALAAKSTGIVLIHISTDYVFSGQSWRPYHENDSPDPQTAYGKTKLAGERALLAVGGKTIIIRTSWLYSEYGKNFFLTMTRLGREKETIGWLPTRSGRLPMPEILLRESSG
jgi:dTDP-4-dehydrorhamnose reductase